MGFGEESADDCARKSGEKWDLGKNPLVIVPENQGRVGFGEESEFFCEIEIIYATEELYLYK